MPADEADTQPVTQQAPPPEVPAGGSEFPTLTPYPRPLAVSAQATGTSQVPTKPAEIVTAASQVPTKPAEIVPVRRRIGRYSILTELGRGGMGIVYLANQEDLNRNVALKVIPSGPDADPAELARFHAEAETAANLSHPNIVQIYEVGEDDHVAFMAMELINGGNLHKHISSKQLDPGEAARLLEPVARGVFHAHKHGVIHRDLKPSNILLQRVEKDPTSFTPKIADFGLAKRVDQPLNLTRTGLAIGTPHYMAPEQARGLAKEVGPQTDIYALGAILYEMLIGYPPFTGNTSMETMRLVVNRKPVAPSKLRTGVPAALEQICLRCLEKEPEKRYPNAEILADALRAFIIKHSMPTLPEIPKVVVDPPKRSAIGRTILLVFAASCLSAALSWFVTAHLLKEKQTTPPEILDPALANDDVQRWLEFDLGLAVFERGEIREGQRRLGKLGQKDKSSAFSLAVEEALVSWSSASLRPVGNWSHEGAFLAASPTQRGLFVTASTQDVRFWYSDTLEAAGFWPVSGTITALACRDDGKFVAVGTATGSVHLWDALQKKPSERILQLDRDKPVITLAFSRDGFSLYGGQEDAGPQQITISTGLRKPLLDTKAKAKLWALHPEGNVFGTDEAGRFQQAGLAPVVAGPANIGVLNELQISPDGSCLAAVTAVGGVKLFLREEGRWFDLPPDGHTTTVCFSSDNNVLVLGTASGTVRLWDAVARQPLTEAMQVGSPVLGVSFWLSENKVLAVTAAGKIHAFATSRLPFATPPMRLELKAGHEVRGLAFGSGSTRLYVTTTLGISTWSVRSGERLTRNWEQNIDQKAHPELRLNMATVLPKHDAEAEAIVVAGHSNEFLVLREKSPPLCTAKLKKTSEITAVAANSTGVKVCAVGRGQERGSVYKFWDKDIGTESFKEWSVNFVVLCEAFLPDGNTLVFGCDDGQIRRWNPQTNELVGQPLNCGSPVTCLAVEGTGQKLAVGCADGTARVWDLTANKQVLQIRAQPELRGVVFYRGLTTASADGTVRSWHLETGRSAGPALRHADALVEMSVANGLLATASRDRVVRVWRLP